MIEKEMKMIKIADWEDNNGRDDSDDSDDSDDNDWIIENC